jgi:hypothetical protein
MWEDGPAIVVAMTVMMMDVERHSVLSLLNPDNAIPSRRFFTGAIFKMVS